MGSLKNVKHFVLDECDKMLDALDMRRDVQEIFRQTPHEKQVMMFSATLSKEVRPVCKKIPPPPPGGSRLAPVFPVPAHKTSHNQTKPKKLCPKILEITRDNSPKFQLAPLYPNFRAIT